MNETFHIEMESAEHSTFEPTEDTLKVIFDEGNHEVVVEHGDVVFYDNLTDDCYSMTEEQFDVLVDKWLHRRRWGKFCQVGSFDVYERLTCEYKEGGGRRCERPGGHKGDHYWSTHTIAHDRAGNGWSCLSFDKPLDYEQAQKLKEEKREQAQGTSQGTQGTVPATA